MSIAQVSNISVTDDFRANPPAEEITKRAEAIRAIDGCEHVYALRNSTGGPGLGILIWRDREAMEAAAAQMASNRAEVQALGMTITTDAVYDTFTEL
jgi:RNA 3'-terminal phosphate cyclase